jgi:two-component system, NtrC family, response regulator GlrR
LLIDTFAERGSEANKLPRVLIGDAALDCLQSYAWPGNIRELENCVKYLTCLQLDRPVDPSDLPLLHLDEKDESVPMDALTEIGPLQATKRELICEFERAYLEGALRRSSGNIAAAARASGKPRRAFFELMRKRGVTASKGALGPMTDSGTDLSPRERTATGTSGQLPLTRRGL